MRRTGFTLVELLVGILIFFVISVTLFLLIQSALSVRESQQDQDVVQGRYQRVLEQIATELECLHPSRSNDCQVVLEGDRLAFCSLYAPEYGLIELEYRMEGEHLERAANPFGRPGTTNIVLAAAGDFEVTAFDGGQESTALELSADTTSGPRIPPILRIRLGQEPGVERQVYLPLSLSVESQVQRQ